MGRDERRERIRKGLQAVWREQGRRFVTFEDSGDDTLFVQFLDGQINLAWPHDDDPSELLPRLGATPPRGVVVLGWSPRGTALLHVGDLRLAETAAYVERLVDRVLDAWDLDVRVEADR